MPSHVHLLFRAATFTKEQPYLESNQERAVFDLEDLARAIRNPNRPFGRWLKSRLYAWPG